MSSKKKRLIGLLKITLEYNSECYRTCPRISDEINEIKLQNKNICMQESDLSTTAITSTVSREEATHRLHAAFGAIAGLTMESSLYPIDTIRTRMKANTTESVALVTQMKTMYKQEGFSSFYRGYSCVLSGSLLYNSLYFYVYEKMKYTVTSREILSSDAAPFLAAFTAGFTANITSLPFMVVKTRMQLKPGEYEYKHFFDGVKQIIKNEGFGKLYLGAPVFFTQSAVETSLSFGFYELFKKILEPFFPTKREFNLPLSIVASVTSAAATGMIINPLDVIVTRLQAVNTQVHGSSTVAGMVKTIYKNEGLQGFMKGVTGTISLYGLGALVLFPTYEVLKGTFGVDLSK